MTVHQNPSGSAKLAKLPGAVFKRHPYVAAAVQPAWASEPGDSQCQTVILRSPGTLAGGFLSMAVRVFHTELN